MPPTSTPSSNQPRHLSRDEVFDILSSQRRRSVIHFLKQHGSSVELQELSTQLAAWETGKPSDQITGDERKRVYTSLQQVHLPKMDANDIIEFDKQEGVIELTSTTDSLDIYFDVVSANDIPWSKYYAGLSGLSIALIIGIWFDFYPLTIVSDVSLTVFMATMFSVSSLAHIYENRQAKLGSQGPPPDLKED
jgi:hypothetical protein